MALHSVGSGKLMPHRTFVLDLAEDVAARRANARDRGDSDRIGGRDSAYHHAVMTKFRQYAKDEPERVKLIDASQPPADVTADLLQNLTDLIG